MASLTMLYAVILTAQTADSSRKSKTHFELSFGQSQLFISDSRAIQVHQQQAVVVPTSSILFFVEFRPSKIIRYPVFLNLPTESKQFIVNGQLVNETSKPVIGFGPEFRLFQLKIDERSKLEMEVGPLATFLFTKEKKEVFAPIIAGRFRVARGENFVMYFGGTYSIGINTWGILYGTGTVF